MQILSNPISALNVSESPKFSRPKGNRGRGTRDVRFFTGSGNTAVSRMYNTSGHNYWNSSSIMDVAMEQIPRSTERISSLSTSTFTNVYLSESKKYLHPTRTLVW